MHRNTFLLVSILAVLAALVVGVNIGRRLSPSTTNNQQLTTRESPSSTPTPSVAFTSYLSRDCGVSFQYPENFQKLEATRSAIFTDPVSATNSVILTCQAKIPRPSLAPGRIEAITLSSDPPGTTVSAKLYRDTSPKDGTPIDELIFAHPKTGLDVFLAGFGQTFQSIITSLKVLH